MTLPFVSSNITKNTTALELYRGQSRELNLALTHNVLENDVVYEVPVDLTGASLYFTMKKSADDQTVLIKKTSADSIEIDISVPTTLGTATIFIDPDDTAYLEAGQYVFDIWVKLNDGSRYPVVEVAEFVLLQPVTLP